MSGCESGRALHVGHSVASRLGGKIGGWFASLSNETVGCSLSTDPPPICYGRVDSGREHAQRGSFEDLYYEHQTLTTL